MSVSLINGHIDPDKQTESKKHTEIFKLKELLEDAHIPFEFTDEGFDWGDGNAFEKYHIEYPCSYKESQDRVCSVIQGWGTYGAEDNLLEIMGLLTPEEEKNNCVCGWLTAQDVFERIQNHYKGGDADENSCN